LTRDDPQRDRTGSRITSPTFIHRTADFSGVDAAILRDVPLVSGLLVAAAGAGGYSADGSPTVRLRGNEGITAILLLAAEGCHFAAHTFPDRGLLLLDLLVPAVRESDKALDVFVRRLKAKEVRTGRVERGGK
jgi:S-adenosylmethionine/arginine decarboxylase-like enzyme